MSEKTSRTPQRISKKPPALVGAWMTYFKRALKLRRFTNYTSEDLVVRTAALVGLIGPVGDPKATEVYQALAALFFTDERIRLWKVGLDQIPAKPDLILRLVLAIQAAGTVEPFERAKFPVVNFIQVALKLPDPKGYVHVTRQGHDKIRSMFHPNTLAYIAERYKGLVGALADPGYHEQVVSAVKTIS